MVLNKPQTEAILSLCGSLLGDRTKRRLIASLDNFNAGVRLMEITDRTSRCNVRDAISEVIRCNTGLTDELRELFRVRNSARF